MEKQLKTGLLTVVLPAYNEEKSVPRAASTIADLLKEAEIEYELLFVDDGSKDRTWQMVLPGTGSAPLPPSCFPFPHGQCRSR